jgi:predicted DNA-binding protein
MSSTRTQVYFTDEQRQRIDRVAQAEGITMAEVVRRAVDACVTADADPASALAATFGSVPEASVPSRDMWRRG